MTAIEAIVLGLVQGLTEFLPVSSSGHLVLAERLLGLTGENLRFIVAVHLGTLLAVLAVYRIQVLRLLKGVLFGRIRRRNGRWRFSNPDTRLALLLVVATIPAVLLGFLAQGWIREAFAQTWAVGLALVLTGVILFGLRFAGDREGEPTLSRSLIVGIAQALAIFPGISRSGLTISAGVYSGMGRTRAADFAFLLSIPIIFGAGLCELKKIAGEGVDPSEAGILIIGGLTAALSGYLAIKVLLRVIKKRGLYYFAYYCWLAGLAVLTLSLC